MEIAETILKAPEGGILDALGEARAEKTESKTPLTKKKRYWTYPDDTEIRTWLTLVWPVCEATWKQLEEYHHPNATLEDKRRYSARTRGIQQAGFRVHNEWKKSELEIDDLMDAVSLFYIEALEVADFMDAEDNGGVNGAGLRELAENLLRAAEDWQDAPRERLADA
jgi:hypothetical protein